MNNRKTIKRLGKKISGDLVDSMMLLDLLKDITISEGGMNTLIEIIYRKVKKSLHRSEKIRGLSTGRFS